MITFRESSDSYDAACYGNHLPAFGIRTVLICLIIVSKNYEQSPYVDCLKRYSAPNLYFVSGGHPTTRRILCVKEQRFLNLRELPTAASYKKRVQVANAVAEYARSCRFTVTGKKSFKVCSNQNTNCFVPVVTAQPMQLNLVHQAEDCTSSRLKVKN